MVPRRLPRKWCGKDGGNGRACTLEYRLSCRLKCEYTTSRVYTFRQFRVLSFGSRAWYRR